MNVLAAGESLKRKNIDEKRQLVHELSKDSDSAFDVLMKWGREELLQVLCAELGEKENNTKLKKDQIINKLLKVVSEKKDSSTTTERNSKIQRKNTSSVKNKGNIQTTRFLFSQVVRIGSEILRGIYFVRTFI